MQYRRLLTSTVPILILLAPTNHLRHRQLLDVLRLDDLALLGLLEVVGGVLAGEGEGGRFIFLQQFLFVNLDKFLNLRPQNFTFSRELLLNFSDLGGYLFYVLLI